MWFYLFFTLIVLQRIGELIIAKRNEEWMKARGAQEFGQEHYPFIVFIHTLFFIVFFLEVMIGNNEINPLWPIILSIFFITQCVRVWALTSLGRYWNTKIIVKPGVELVSKGPYRFLKHPNYLVVTIEFIVIPLLFQAYFTAFFFSVLNVIILRIRIAAEERALNLAASQ
ncbi:isoprenylcysteine carboxylmethyltransferase family protein [Niallia sp. XMNu-256]|uniref:isoprenylcysteine carboxyl methyltransferase family protein n=1 Tax=Niallia sp. XMNu-256 TaxID=3082444 RepID=UPI0030CAAE4D